MASAFSFIFYLPLYLQAVLGKTASQVGLWLLIGAFSALTGSLGGGMKTTREYYRLTIVSYFGLLWVPLSLTCLRLFDDWYKQASISFSIIY